MAMAVLVTPLAAAIALIFWLSSGNFSLSRKTPSKETVLEWRPGLNGDFLQAAVIQNAAIPVDGGINFHVDVDPGVDHAGVGDAELELVEDDFLLDEFASTAQSASGFDC